MTIEREEKKKDIEEQINMQTQKAGPGSHFDFIENLKGRREGQALGDQKYHEMKFKLTKI